MLNELCVPCVPEKTKNNLIITYYICFASVERVCSPNAFALCVITNRHIPKAKATTIAETPELKRIAENTKIQSNVKYHAEFEKTKGKLTQVSDGEDDRRQQYVCDKNKL